MRIALIKTSSMGDVIHALPVVTDIVEAIPRARIDWVVEESFADLPRLHPRVDNVIPVAVRRWRRAPFARRVRDEVGAVRARLREGGYDLALDLQGLVKSAVVARWTGAPVAGFSWRCAREPLATLAYARRYLVRTDIHAIERLRELAGAALGYRVTGLPRFGLDAGRSRSADDGSLGLNDAGTPALNDAASRIVPAPSWLPQGPFVVLLHATSRAEKLWPRQRWVELGTALRAAGFECLLPWGSEHEREAATALAAAIAGARLAPAMTLSQCAAMLACATGVVGVDTGLTHLSAALDTRTVALFAATPAWRFGPYWSPRAVNLGSDGQWPQAQEVLAALDAIGCRCEPRDPSLGESGTRTLW